MNVVWPVIGLVLGVLVVTALAVRSGVPAPILLVVAGFGVSFLPGVPDYQVSPELVLTVLLPPLLYGAAFESSAVAFRRMIRPILQLSVALVLLTAFSVALVLEALVPGLPFAAALALGAIVAPPDAVAAIAVAKKVGLPQRLVTVLEGESLFNDATSLVTLKVAIAALGGSALRIGPAVGEFVWASVGGVLIGVAFGFALSFLRRRFGYPLTTTALSLVTPFAAYLVGEAAHASGVLVVVVTGLVLGYRSPAEVSAIARLTESSTWAAVRYVLEGVVFALIGLQLWAVIRSLDTDSGHVYLGIAGVLATVIVSRPVWIVVINLVARVVPSKTTVKPGPRQLAAVSWAGMRGVVSLAAAQTLPLNTPLRSLLLVCTTAVIVATLVAQGLTLPWLIRRLGIVENRQAEEVKERTEAHSAAGAAIKKRVDELVDQEHLSDRQAEMMRRWADLRDWRSWDDEDESRRFGQRLSRLSDWRRSLLAIERSTMISLRNDGRLSEDVLLDMQRELDLEEALLERRSEVVDGHLEELPDADDSSSEVRRDTDTDADADADADDADADDADAGAGLDGAGEPETPNPDDEISVTPG